MNVLTVNFRCVDANLVEAPSVIMTSVASTTRHVQFTLDYIDSPLFQQLIEQILSGDVDPRDVDWSDVIAQSENATEHVMSSPPTVTTSTNDSASSGFSWALFVPLCAAGFLILLIAFCLLKHVWTRRCVVGRQQSATSLFRARAEPYIDNARNSTRSTAALQRSYGDRASMRSHVSESQQPAIFFTKVTRLGSIPESQEEYYSRYNKPRKISLPETLTPDSQSSLSSLFSRMTNDGHNILSNSAMYPASEKTPDTFQTLTQSFPNLVFTAQSTTPPPTVPYHLTWITPLSSQSEPVLVDHVTATTLQRRLFAQLEKKVNNTALQNTTDAVAKMYQGDIINDVSKSSGINKSPFHPNNNTPTNGSDELCQSDVIINQTHAILPDSMASHHITGSWVMMAKFLHAVLLELLANTLFCC